MEPLDKKDYEVAFLAKTEEAAREVLTLLGQHQAEVGFEGPLKKIALAYPVQKEQQAHFGFLYVKLDPASAKSLEHDLQARQSVLRFLLIRLPSSKTALAAVPKPRSRPVTRPPLETTRPTLPLSNEALEKKIEEILQ